mmetsp:Transcript_1880/g.7829  ORF Transcript_1880/g.7829 Transcript_1880/m.7829 type:complete len:526 (-) Transcript_1880:2173-3750(-)
MAPSPAAAAAAAAMVALSAESRSARAAFSFLDSGFETSSTVFSSLEKLFMTSAAGGARVTTSSACFAALPFFCEPGVSLALYAKALSASQGATNATACVTSVSRKGAPVNQSTRETRARSRSRNETVSWPSSEESSEVSESESDTPPPSSSSSTSSPFARVVKVVVSVVVAASSSDCALIRDTVFVSSSSSSSSSVLALESSFIFTPSRAMASALSSSSCSAYRAAARRALADLPRGRGFCFLSDAFLFAAAFFGGFGFGSNSSSFCGRPGRTRSSSCDTPSIVFEFESVPFKTAPFFIAFFIARRSAAETRAFPPRAEYFSIASGASSALSASSPSRSQCAACSSACSSATGACARVVSTDPSRNASSALDAGRRVSSERRRGPLLFSSGSSVSSSSSSWKRSSVSSSTRVVLSAACLLTSSSPLTKNTYAYPITSGAGGKYRLRPTCHTTPGASASPFSATRRTAPDGTHHALITVLVSHAALRHKHAAPACAKDKEGTRHLFVCVPESFFPSFSSSFSSFSS